MKNEAGPAAERPVALPFAVPESRWDAAVEVGLTPEERLLYRSNLLGSDLTVTNFGGGNTSAKLMEKDPLTGEQVAVLWVKGSGGDIGSMKLDGFSTLYLDKFRATEKLYRGVEFEDEMVGYLPNCTFNLNPRAASIDTPLHGLLPFAHIDHVHPDAIIALAASSGGEAATREIWKGQVGWLPWKRPGFELGVQLRDYVAANPGLRGVMLSNHGIICWGETSRDCYENTISLIADAAGHLNLRLAGKPAFGGQVFAPLPASERASAAAHLMPRLRANMPGARGKVGHFSDDAEALETMTELYRPLLEQTFEAPEFLPRPTGLKKIPLVVTSLTSAEMIKYAANSFLALKISFANEIANISERVGADVRDIMRGIGLDQRIGERFLNAGIGWGGSCFGKDIQSLMHTAREYGYRAKILEASYEVNRTQRQHVIQRLQERLFILKGRTIALLGLAFKPDTDDLRDAPSLDIAEHLLAMGARVKAYDPVAMEACQRQHGELAIHYCEDSIEALRGADAMVLVTEWPEFGRMDLNEAGSVMARKVLVDGRNLYNPEVARAAGFDYCCIGRPQCGIQKTRGAGEARCEQDTEPESAVSVRR